jgi:hypothetical protein
MMPGEWLKIGIRLRCATALSKSERSPGRRDAARYRVPDGFGGGFVRVRVPDGFGGGFVVRVPNGFADGFVVRCSCGVVVLVAGGTG